jgi:hypothetical protein
VRSRSINIDSRTDRFCFSACCVIASQFCAICFPNVRGLKTQSSAPSELPAEITGSSSNLTANGCTPVVEGRNVKSTNVLCRFAFLVAKNQHGK